MQPTFYLQYKKKHRDRHRKHNHNHIGQHEFVGGRPLSDQHVYCTTGCQNKWSRWSIVRCQGATISQRAHGEHPVSAGPTEAQQALVVSTWGTPYCIYVRSETMATWEPHVLTFREDRGVRIASSDSWSTLSVTCLFSNLVIHSSTLSAGSLKRVRFASTRWLFCIG